MNNIEKKLLEEKRRIDSIETPNELEARLHKALDEIPTIKRRNVAFLWKVAIVAICLISLIGYNYNALAYYSKKILGFDEMLFGSIKNLNDNDMGQVINKSIKLDNGTTFTINGIMSDENQFLMFYTLSNPDGIDEEEGYLPFMSINGFMTNSSGSGGTGQLNEDGTEMKWIKSFDPVNLFAKKLTLVFWQLSEDDEDQYEITFNHDPNKAMQATMKQAIQEVVSVDHGTITFQSITASPTLTVLEGSVDQKQGKFEGVPLQGIRLVANGHSVGSKGNESTTTPLGTTFKIDYDALPQELASLQVVLQKFPGYEEINKKIQLDTGKKAFFPLAEGTELLIKKVTETSEGTEITIATDHDVILDGVAIETKDGTIPLKTTENIGDTMQINARNMNERIFVFDTKETAEYLIIEGIHYMKPYNHTIDIRVK